MTENLPAEAKTNPWSQEFAVQVPGGKDYSISLGAIKKLFRTSQDTTLEECAMFAKKCQQYGADPIMNDMHLIKYSKKEGASIVTGVGFFQKRAALNPKFKGYAKTRWAFLVDGEIDWTETWIPSYHGKYPLACEASCFVDGYQEKQSFTVNWDENVKMVPEWSKGEKIGEKIGSTWDKMPSRMLEKVAMVALLRQVFPEQFGGLYIAEEMGKDDQVEQQQKDMEAAQEVQYIEQPKGDDYLTPEEFEAQEERLDREFQERMNREGPDITVSYTEPTEVQPSDVDPIPSQRDAELMEKVQTAKEVFGDEGLDEELRELSQSGGEPSKDEIPF